MKKYILFISCVLSFPFISNCQENKLLLFKHLKDFDDYFYSVKNDNEFISMPISLKDFVIAVEEIKPEKIDHLVYYYWNAQKTTDSAEETLAKLQVMSDVIKEFEELPLIFPHLNTVELNFVGITFNETNFRNLINKDISNIEISNIDLEKLSLDFPNLFKQ